MAEVFHRNFFLDGKAGRLEAMLWTAPPSNQQFVGLVCHPHPLFGGTMHNKVVYQAAKALHRLGIPVLRFNFRGTALSEGQHDRGRGEQDDVRTAIEFLSLDFPNRPIVLAGFSFGSWVGLRVGCQDRRVTRVIGIGVPVDRTEMSFLRNCQKPKLFIQGSNDEFGARGNVRVLFDTLAEPKSLVVVEGADHFFQGKLSEVADAIDHWVSNQEGG